MKSIKEKDAGLTVCICFIPVVSAHLSGPVASVSYNGTKLYKPSACSGTSNKAHTLLLTPIMLLQLSETVTKITKQRKPAPALSETSC